MYQNNPCFNGYTPYPYGYQQQMQRQGQMVNMQNAQPQPQQFVQPIQYEPPIRDIKFVTSEEAKAYIVMPNSSVLLIDKQQQKAYLKSADQMGQSFMEEYSFSNVKNINSKPIDSDCSHEKNENDNLSNYITKDALQGYNFATKEDIQALSARIDKLVVKPAPQVVAQKPMPKGE